MKVEVQAVKFPLAKNLFFYNIESKMFAKRASQFLLNQFNRSSPISRNFFVTPTNVSKIPNLTKSPLSNVIIKKPTKLEDKIQFIYVFVL